MFFRVHDIRKRRGFTLTEIAIVLGIVGVVLSGIWVAASRVYANNRLQKAVGEASLIIQGYRSLYSTRSIDTGNWGDITCMGVNSGFFPADMIQSGVTCNSGTTATYPLHPWGGYVTVWSFQLWNGIIIGFANLSQQPCNQLAQQLVSGPDILYENINGTSVGILPPAGSSAPFTTTQINNLCANNSNNYIDIMYKAQ